MEAVTDVGGAFLLGVVVLVAVAWASGAPGLAWPPRWRELGPALARRAAALDPATSALVIAISIIVIAITGSAFLIGDVDIGFLVINEEQSLPAYFGSALLLVAGMLALALASVRPAGSALWPYALLGIVLVGLGFDEAAEIHERLESRLDASAAVVLAPVALAGLVAFAGLVPRLRVAPPALALFVGGGLAWAIAQSLDPIHSVDWKSSIEETLELSGSALFLLALQRLARDLSPH